MHGTLHYTMKIKMKSKINYVMMLHLKHGFMDPVCKKLYDVYSNNYGQVEKYDGDINPLITGELKKFLDNIYKTFGKYSGDELESMTHREMPWQNARNTLAPYMPSNEVISEEDMFVYYNSLNG